ncbi:hypothetical protein NBT05_01690 [Aquimarina sp. ERC-38]|uniref:hypothetical protein n=1 Tax=Aquimarina sp. ERC-38 TaxID=2949996 RepID=UPI002247AAA4|nr:hypothetical protein [Aquimarina sp. ERC-38]UZO81199.1 hypothetical protein NBT05_01690 [Aquimarina sp. ERC-38]
MKKFLVLGVLFILPLVAYLFFASGVHNFAKLPVLETNVGNLTAFTPLDSQKVVTLQDKITILSFLGDQLHHREGNAFNLNQKIYKKNYEFKDFQFVVILPYGSEAKATELLKELGNIADVSNWNYLFGTPEQIQSFFKSLKTPYQLDEHLGTDYVFIIDKDNNLRGRDADSNKKEVSKYGYNASSVAELSDEMNDDVKVILAEYRLALKKYKADRKN